MHTATIRSQHAEFPKVPTLLIEVSAGVVSGLLVASVLDGAPDDDRILAYCLAGSFFGSLAHILRFKIYEHDGVVASFFGNAIIAAILSPYSCDMICGWLKIPVTFRACLFISGLIGLLGGWVGKSLIPILGAKLEGVVRAVNLGSIITSFARMWGFKRDEPRDRKPRRKPPTQHGDNKPD